jgi:hypothetical protein
MLALALGAGLVAGAISWGIGEGVANAWVPPFETANMMGNTIKKVRFEDQTAADSKNATLAFAILGAVTGASLGLAGGLARSATVAGMKAALAGLVLGAAAGAGAALALLPVYFHALDVSQEALSRDLMLPLLVHAGIWAACGFAGGLAFGIGVGARRTRLINAALGGLIGAAIGAALYEIVGAAAFPADRTTSPVAITWKARLLARILVAVLSALLAALMINAAGSRSEPAPPKRAA